MLELAKNGFIGRVPDDMLAAMPNLQLLSLFENRLGSSAQANDLKFLSSLSSLAAARADNFYYPPEWTPKQGSLNKFHYKRKTEDFDIEDAETFALPADEEEDLAKKKEAEPVLVRLQRVSDARHSDDYALNKALRARLRNQKKRVADEEAVARKIGLGIRLLPGSEEDSSMAKHVKFSSKFDKNKKNKRVAIVSSSIFSGYRILKCLLRSDWSWSQRGGGLMLAKPQAC
ncbi:hypothetical protein Syun_031467 [Stephania yunnanensis]|uniref:Uncharacterized protein n=1 Tax=Stephania yunnanensis TaxID=152371 RepID=A0AAP0DZA3_9MAGN